MSNSLFQGTVWYWRQGIRDASAQMVLCDYTKTRELYLPIKNEEQGEALRNELNNKITISLKRTHSNFDVVPAGSLIAFAAEPLAMNNPEERRNMEKLQNYILTHGGKIVGKSKQSIIGNLFNFFRGGRK